ncbi:ABC transporter permease [Clostridium aestuarii]|uniref:ABC transporter permease n=1 Tax=Clostridium aestuarii TaxID=338193 RepID=A0ABT4CWQ9_9CLOT|nr:ABC transporter permease [Clostridium aestuarii]MCY6483435.1 ABC transporter permease [Clostridium aestuarii]
MKILYIIFYNLKRNFRDKKTLINMLLLPIVLILILGTALNNEYIPGNISRAQVYYYNEDKGEISKQFEKYITSDKVKDLIELKKVNSKKEGLNSIKTNERRTFVYLDNNFTKNIKKGGKAYISVYNERNTIQTEIVKNILNGFVNGANAVYASYTIGGKGGYVGENNIIIDASIDISGKIPKAIDYYAVTMLVMILMYGAFYGSDAISQIYEEEEGRRVQITPTQKTQILLGYIASSILTVFIEGIILMLIAKYAFKANYGNNIGLIVFIIFTMSILSNFIGMVVIVLGGKADKTSGVINILVIVCTFISGGYVKLINNNGVYNKIIHFVPNTMAHNAMFNSIYGSNMDAVNSNIASMWIGIVLCMIISIAAARRRVLK